MALELNERAAALCDQLPALAEKLQIATDLKIGGARVFDLGINVPGSLDAGLMLARICLADLADVELFRGHNSPLPGQALHVATRHPVEACLASQYAGWQLSAGKFFALGSGPMRAAAGREALFKKIGATERAKRVVGVLETRQFPPVEIVEQIAQACEVSPENVTLLVAPTASLAGGVQIVARSIETGLHKLVELGFDVRQVSAAIGTAPIPPVAGDDMVSIGRTNDAILYGGSVQFFVDVDPQQLTAIAPQVPSCASRDYGVRFAQIFQRYNHDFYAIDPLLFSPAEVMFENHRNGESSHFGKLAFDVVLDSFNN